MLEPWIIEQIKRKEEEEKRRREGEIQPTVPADDPSDLPENDPAEEDRWRKEKEEEERKRRDEGNGGPVIIKLL